MATGVATIASIGKAVGVAKLELALERMAVDVKIDVNSLVSNNRLEGSMEGTSIVSV